jgi:hypothetical protein
MIYKGIIHGTEWDFVMLLRMVHNLKLIKWFLGGIFSLIFSGHSWTQVTEIVESKTMDEGELLYSVIAGQAD